MTGGLADGADVKKGMTEVSTSHDYTADATLKNLGELDGLCNLGPGSGCTSPSTCEFNLAMKIEVSSGDTGNPLPYDFRVGGSVTLLSSTGGTYPFTGTSETKNYDGLSCEGSQNVSVKVRDSSANNILEAQFELQCLDCPAASGGP